ncbi:MAG: hypothetical protein IKP20_04355 [Candidatus Methanomethylophilaceae archaeon]|nr:hypothetical protein [Candidatus Methanomethylophilaceae archaeon]
MNKTILIIVAVVAAIAVVALAAFVLLSGPKWDDPVDNWVLSQDVNEGDYLDLDIRLCFGTCFFVKPPYMKLTVQ